jgi:hypothetical protein
MPSPQDQLGHDLVRHRPSARGRRCRDPEQLSEPAKCIRGRAAEQVVAEADDGAGALRRGAEHEDIGADGDGLRSQPAVRSTSSMIDLFVNQVRSAPGSARRGSA